MSVVAGEVDRAGAVRGALRRLVARRGFHGASMSAVAREAGVATGTAYVHYASKDDLVLAAYVDAKLTMGRAAVGCVDHDAAAPERFRQLWFGVIDHLRAEPEVARFLVQVDCSPYAGRAHERATAAGSDPLIEAAAAPDLLAVLAPLPLTVVYDLGIGPALRLVAAGTDLSDEELSQLAESCWRAISR